MSAAPDPLTVLRETLNLSAGFVRVEAAREALAQVGTLVEAASRCQYLADIGAETLDAEEVLRAALLPFADRDGAA